MIHARGNFLYLLVSLLLFLGFLAVFYQVAEQQMVECSMNGTKKRPHVLFALFVGNTFVHRVESVVHPPVVTALDDEQRFLPCVHVACPSGWVSCSTCS